MSCILQPWILAVSIKEDICHSPFQEGAQAWPGVGGHGDMQWRWSERLQTMGDEGYNTWPGLLSCGCCAPRCQGFDAGSPKPRPFLSIALAAGPVWPEAAPEWPRMVQVSNKGPTVSPRLKIILELLPSLVAPVGTVPLFSLTLCLHHEWVLQRVLQRGPIQWISSTSAPTMLRMQDFSHQD